MACLGRWDCGTRRLGMVAARWWASQEAGEGGYMVVFMQLQTLENTSATSSKTGA